MLPLSVFIITKNEEARLPRTLEAVVEWAGEIIVADSGSSDRTVDIAKAYEATVIHRQFAGYGNQGLCAEQRCRYDWVLNIDSDEVVTTDLRAEIMYILVMNAHVFWNMTTTLFVFITVRLHPIAVTSS